MPIQNHYRITGLLIISMLFAACQKWDEYKKYTTGGEKIYPGIGSAIVHSGRNRVVLDWALNNDPNVTGYKLYWNNGADSLSGSVPPAAIGDTLHIMVNNLREGSYNFKLYALDKVGNLSVPATFSGRTYGSIYENNLFNRILKGYSYNFFVRNVYTSWNVPDTVNLTTKLTYTGTDSLSKTLWLTAGSPSLVVNDWLEGTIVYYQSYYKPNRMAVDSFKVPRPDTLRVTPPAQATFGATGQRKNYSATGAFVNANAINLDKKLRKTTTANVFETNDVANLSNYPNTRIVLTLNADNTIDVSGYVSGTLVVTNHPTAGKSYYDPVAKLLVLRYKYTNADGSYQLMEETWNPK